MIFYYTPVVISIGIQCFVLVKDSSLNKKLRGIEIVAVYIALILPSAILFSKGIPLVQADATLFLWVSLLAIIRFTESQEKKPMVSSGMAYTILLALWLSAIGSFYWGIVESQRLLL